MADERKPPDELSLGEKFLIELLLDPFATAEECQRLADARARMNELEQDETRRGGRSRRVRVLHPW